MKVSKLNVSFLNVMMFQRGTQGCSPPKVRAANWKHVRPERLSPAVAMMVLLEKHYSKPLALPSVCSPTACVYAADNPMIIRGYKHMTGTPRHAHVDALCGPW